MAEVIAIAGIVVPSVVSAVAPVFLEFVKMKMNERKESLADIHEALKMGLEGLVALQEDKAREVSSNYEQKDPSNLYKTWEKRVLKIFGEVSRLNGKYDNVKKNKRSIWTFWNNPQSQVKKEIKRELRKVIELLQTCPEKFLFDKEPDPVIEEISVPQIAEYPTLQNALDDIQAQVKMKGLKCVALYGEKGVGKTTIMQHLNNHHFNDNRVDKEFDMVIFIKVAADAQTDAQTEESHILQKIAERIMVGGKGDELVRKIQTVLQNAIYFLILDGVRHALALHEIWGKLGISSHESDSKVVISTHYPLALKSKCVEYAVNLETLSPDEALKMFENTVGGSIFHDKPNAHLICKRLCSCLPLLIVPIANSFTAEGGPDWETNLNECMHYWPAYGVDGLDELYSTLEICYERLRDPSKQKFFLYAALYPANSNIYTDYFVECCIVQGFLGNVNPATNYGSLHSRGIHTILKHLVNVAFLEEGEQMRQQAEVENSGDFLRGSIFLFPSHRQFQFVVGVCE